MTKAPPDPAAPKRPKPVTRDWLLRAAAHYLERYAASAETLRRVLTRKVRRRADALGEDAAGFAPLVEEAIAHLASLKLVDDASFASARYAALRRRGTSRRQAGQALAAKGIDRETVGALIAADETSDADAALVFAKRRRLGPHRTRERAERRERDIAAMMRAGFSLAEARRAVDADLG